MGPFINFARMVVLWGVIGWPSLRTTASNYEGSPPPTWNQQQTRCNIVKYVGFGELLSFQEFPPQTASGVPFLTHGYGQPKYEQCTWTFRTDDDCALELRTLEYVQGDVRCEEQHLLIGDEYVDTR